MKKFNIALIVALISLNAFSECNNQYAQTNEECAALKSWHPENFTHVEDLDKTNEFQIIYHSITGFGWSTGPKPGSWNEKLLANPKLITNNPKISASIISNKKFKTFRGHVGFILEAQPENVVATSPMDAGSPPIKSFSKEDLLSLDMFSTSKCVDIKTPKYILSKTSKYNEVVLTGKNQGRSVDAVGIIIRCAAKKMIRLNNLKDNEFKQYILKSCTEFSHGIIPTLNRLKDKYPMYGFELE